MKYVGGGQVMSGSGQYGCMPYIKQYLLQVKPKSLLEISSDYGVYGGFCKAWMISLYPEEKVVIDRVLLQEKSEVKQGIYENIYSEEQLKNLNPLNQYEMILFFDLMQRDKEELLKTISAIYPFMTECLLIVNVYEKEEMSKIHPTLLTSYDFTYYRVKEGVTTYQFYALYPNAVGEVLPIDERKWVSQEEEEKIKKRKLRVGYLLPHGNLTGGMKCLLEQMRQLQKKGHQVIAYRRCREGEAVLPSWSDLKLETDIEKAVALPERGSLESYLGEDLDVIVVGWMMQLPELPNFNRPILLWEQGSEYMYGDYKQPMGAHDPLRDELRQLYRLPVKICSVATTLQDILWHKYRRKSWLLPNGIDTQCYYPEPMKVHGRTILLIGNPYLAFKGFDVAIKVLDLLWKKGCQFKVVWVCQARKEYGVKPYAIAYQVLPSQEDLAKYCREADVFLSTSLYESFPMPPMEAMASGLPVVATDCGGIMTYARDGYNAFICQQGDIEALADALELLLNNLERRVEMGGNGRKTALEYDFSKIVERVEACLYDSKL